MFEYLHKLISWTTVVLHVSVPLVVLVVHRDDPEQWLHKVESSPIEMLIVLFPLLWQQGIGVELMQEGGQSSSFLFILQDQNHTVNFFSFLTGNIIYGNLMM
jgi:hypothetical protein